MAGALKGAGKREPRAGPPGFPVLGPGLRARGRRSSTAYRALRAGGGAGGLAVGRECPGPRPARASPAAIPPPQPGCGGASGVLRGLGGGDPAPPHPHPTPEASLPALILRSQAARPPRDGGVPAEHRVSWPQACLRADAEAGPEPPREAGPHGSGSGLGSGFLAGVWVHVETWRARARGAPGAALCLRGGSSGAAGRKLTRRHHFPTRSALSTLLSGRRWGKSSSF